MQTHQEENATAMAPMIAIIGCDGSGKSTVSEEILSWIQIYGPSATAHLGKQAGNVGRSIANLPIIGRFLGRFIDKKAAKVVKNRKTEKTQGIFVSLVICAFSLRRVRRFRRMLELRRQGFIVVTDRYPQLEISGAYDGPGLSIDAGGNFIVRWLARREHAAYEWMTSYRPDLVLRLNVDLDTACARKPDHQRELLSAKVAVTPLLKFNGAKIAEIDSNQALSDVLANAKQAVAQLMAEKGYATRSSE